jgi:hypothetical protein
MWCAAAPHIVTVDSERDGGIRMVDNDRSVTIETAAEVMQIEVRTIRQWSAIGSISIERRNDIELVDLRQVQALVRSGVVPSARAARRGALRGLLREAGVVDARSVAGLQELARERATAGR